MDDASMQLFKEVWGRLDDDQWEKMVEHFGGILTELKEAWEADPASVGKTITYSELWEEYCRNMQSSGEERSTNG